MFNKDTCEIIQELRTIELSDEQLPLLGLLCEAAETIESLAANLDKVMEERDKLIVERDTLLDRLHEASETAETLDLARHKEWT